MRPSSAWSWPIWLAAACGGCWWSAGARLGTGFLTGGLVDELQLVIAPFFVGDAAAPRFAGPGRYPAGPGQGLRLAEVRPVGEVVLLRYLSPAAAAQDGTLGRVSEVPDG